MSRISRCQRKKFIATGSRNFFLVKTDSKQIFSRHFSTSYDAEPEFLVRAREYGDPRKLNVPYLDDSVRQEMYAKYISNPETWTITALSQHYKSSIRRTTAVVMLMHNRYKMMKDKGFLVEIKGDTNRPVISVEIPPIWSGIYSKYMEDPKQDINKILAEYNASINNDAHKTKMSGEEAKNIIDKVADHFRRLDNLTTQNELMDETLQMIKKAGVDTTFREPRRGPTKKKHQKHAFSDVYFPQMLGDDVIDEEKRKIEKRLAEEAREEIKPNVELFHETAANPLPVDTSLHPSDSNTPKDMKISRWKIAFKDISKSKQNEVKANTSASAKEAGITAQTIIRTRKGE